MGGVPARVAAWGCIGGPRPWRYLCPRPPDEAAEGRSESGAAEEEMTAARQGAGLQCDVMSDPEWCHRYPGGDPGCDHPRFRSHCLHRCGCCPAPPGTPPSWCYP